MILDREEHREIILSIANAIQFNGKREEVKKAIAELDEVIEAVKNAEVKK
jgi:hypothetical protein